MQRERLFLTAGKGDMLVWASKDGKFGYAKLSFGKDHELVVKMDKTAGDGHAVDFELVPPPENAELPAVTPEQRAANDRRMVHEDSIRNAYVSMFMTDETARYFAGSTSSTKMPFHGYWSLPEETIGSLPTSWHGCALKSPKEEVWTCSNGFRQKTSATLHWKF